MNYLQTSLLACSLGALLSCQAYAQIAPIEFRMIAAKGNPSSCMNVDASMSRVHTLVIMGDKAVLKSAGGINDNMKQSAPNVYKTSYTLSGATLNIVADTSKVPKTLVALEPKLGCRWEAVAP